MATPQSPDESAPASACASAQGPARAAADVPSLPRATIVTYGLPAIGYGYLFFLTTLYLLKYATDVLLIGPAAMGIVFGASRVWDAVSDPIAGYLSDRTRARLGRRRSWMRASAIPLAVLPVMIWSPPSALEGGLLVAWMAVGVFAFYTATTVFSVPHASLGAELTSAHHDRTRIYAFRHVFFGVGTFLSIGAMYLLIEAEDKRGAAQMLVLAGALLTAVLIFYSTARLRERPDYQGRGADQPARAFADVVRNPHARLLLGVFLIENVGAASLGVLGPYVLQYIIGDESMFPILLLAYLIPTLAFVPLGVPLSRRFGKKTVWAASMLLSAFAYGALFFAGEGDYLWLCACGVAAGVSNAFGSIVGPSIQADVIDYDEYQTGQRKEGAYFAAFNLVMKSSYGIALALAGVALQTVGYVPGGAQSETTILAMRGLFSLVPFAGYLIGVLLFTRFRLDEAEHQRIRAELDARAAASTRPA